MTTRILVTGAQGFLGRHLAARLLGADSETRVLGIGRSPRLEDTFTHSVHWGSARVRAPLPVDVKASLESRRYEYASLDIARQSELTGLLGEFRPHRIFHLASGLRDDAPDHLFRTNVEGTIHLIEGIVEAGLETPTLIFGSTGYLYGQIAAEALPVREDMPCAPIDLYGVSKLASEHASRILTRRYGLRGVWARIFNLVGPGQEERHFCGRMTSQAAAIAAGLLPPRVEMEPLTTTRDFLDVRDAARALELLGRCGVPGATYNVASGVESPTEGVFKAILCHARLEGKVAIELKPPRPADLPRYVADVTRLGALGFIPRV